MEQFPIYSQPRFPDLNRKTLELMVAIFSYRRKITGAGNPNEDDIGKFFDQFTSSDAIMEWLLTVPVPVLEEVKKSNP